MTNESFRTYLSVKNAFERMDELDKFLSSLQLHIDAYGEDITLNELKNKLVKESCNIGNKLLTCCKDIKL